mgnify:CR=1 FL=1
MDRLSEMEAFAAVVDQGGFTGAALKLGISKSAVSKHVSSLEARLGARLLNRTTRRVNPTDVGMLYYDRARSVLTAASEADAAVSGMQAAPAGTLTILAPQDFGSCVLSPLVAEFLDQHPELDIRLELTQDLAEVGREDIDLSLRLGTKPDSALRTHKLDTVIRHLVASPAYLERRGSPARIEDLAQHDLLHQTDPAGDPSWSLVSQTGETRIVRTKGRLVASCGQSLLTAALAGQGIAFLPDFLVDDAMAAGRLRNAMPGLPVQTQSLYVAHPPSHGSRPRVRGFVDFLIEAYARPVAARAIA